MAETVSLPKIGDPAPDFEAVTTVGPLKFSEWQKDNWVVLFSHPADFTPVCSTELTELARQEQRFATMKTKLMGVSIDSVHAHLAWIDNLKKMAGGAEIKYPLVADSDMKVASLYGMIHPGASSTATVRAVFVIDPKRVIRAIIYYPMNAGRNVEEIVRIVQALQTADKGCATPVNWKPGDKVVVPPPKTLDEVEERGTHKEYERKDFYLNLTSPPK